jgi:hypothetical protein
MNNPTFDPDFGPGLFHGEFTDIKIIDPQPTPLNRRNLVIDPTKPFQIEMDWKLEGFFVKPWLAALGGNWSIQVFAESVGPGPDVQIGSVSVPVGAITNPRSYKATITVPANTLPEGNPGQPDPSGVYNLVCTCFLNSSLGDPGYDIAGFAEGPTIRVEDPN